jgi:hypothetical protein
LFSNLFDQSRSIFLPAGVSASQLAPKSV